LAYHSFSEARSDTVLVEQVDVVGLQADERRFGDGADVLRTAVGTRDRAVFQLEAELGGDDHVLAHRRQRFAHQLFVDVGSVGLGGIEKVDAAFHGRTQHTDAFAFLDRLAGSEAQVHGTHAQCRHRKTAVAQLTHFHLLLHVIDSGTPLTISTLSTGSDCLYPRFALPIGILLKAVVGNHIEPSQRCTNDGP
jgi:hypothetical protein